MTKRPARSALAGLAAALAVTGTVVALPFGPFSEAEPAARSAVAAASPAAAPAVAGTVQAAPLVQVSERQAELTQATTKPFSMVGVTWDDVRSQLVGTVQIRTRSGAGAWSRWLTLDADHGDSIDGGDEGVENLRGGTAPLWVGPSDGIQVRVNGRTGGALPAGLRVDLIDPGDPASPTRPSSPSDPNANDDSTDTGDSTGTTGAAGITDATAARASVLVPVAFAGAPAPVDESEPSPEAPTPDPPAEPTEAPTTEPTTEPTAEPTVTLPPAPEVPPTLDPTTAPTPAVPEPTAADPTPTVTPSAEPTPTPAPSSTPVPTRPPAGTSPVTAPKITPRAGWQADERIRKPGDPSYAAAAKVAFVHHSDTAVDYACTDSAKILRGMYTYHVSSQGWNDLGYNFAVDKCGTIFEGRAGGVDLPVIGSHTYGFNTGSTGIVVIGDYVTVKASSAAVAAVARVSAWKLGFAGVSPTGTASLVQAAANSSGFVQGRSYSFNAVSGHRDGRATECPGEMLYGQLPAVRSLATTVAAATVGDLTGATRSASTWYTPANAITVNWKTGTPSALIARQEVLLNSKVAATVKSGDRKAALTLTPGRHQIAVRTVHVTGRTATSAPANVVVDATAPTFSTSPKVNLRTGTVSSTAVPVTVRWKATDAGGLSTVTATKPTKATFSPTATTWKTTAKPAGRRTFTLTALDLAGNSRTASTTGTPTLIKETAAKRTGTWSTRTNSKHLNGSALLSTGKNASLTWTFTGTSVTWIAARTSTSGKATIYLDGTKAATIDLKSTATTYRQGVWSAADLKPGKHTLKIVVSGTAGRPSIHSDGIAVLGP